MRLWMLKAGLLVGALALGGCLMRDIRWQSVRPPSGVKEQTYRLVTTAYCPCGTCCGWKRNWYGKPVIAYGPNRGQPKAVGITASGTRARPGTIAADTTIFPFGTVMYIPGYGYGVVEDRGGAIKGYHIDLYYNSHKTALQWGREIKEVKVWMPQPQRRR
ncbi:MAG TPA: 3D domain-containing protein [Kiritimatiellia bacterium]|nr:3D domain-containing protein [Kiritimatiellia bacterium]